MSEPLASVDVCASNAAMGRARTATVGTARVSTARSTSRYSNVCTVNGTREKVVLNFGLNQDRDRMAPEPGIAVLKRIVLGPHAARRSSDRVGNVLAEYGKHFREVKLYARTRGEAIRKSNRVVGCRTV